MIIPTVFRKILSRHYALPPEYVGFPVGRLLKFKIRENFRKNFLRNFRPLHESKKVLRFAYLITGCRKERAYLPADGIGTAACRVCLRICSAPLSEPAPALFAGGAGEVASGRKRRAAIPSVAMITMGGDYQREPKVYQETAG